MKIPGEYPSASDYSKNPTLLAAAHRTPITPREAELLIADLMVAHGEGLDLAGQRVLGGPFDRRGFQVHFGWARRGRAHCRLRNPYISLPTSELTQAAVDAGQVVGTLRVGVVLHEFAHLLTPREHHGPRFWAVLDILCETTRVQWEARTLTPNPAAAIRPVSQTLAAEAPAPRVPIGQRVTWSSAKFGTLAGVVRSAYANCRARVKTDDGREFYVPPAWLRAAGEGRG